MIATLHNQVPHTPDIECIYPHWLHGPRTAACYRNGMIDGHAGCYSFDINRECSPGAQAAYNAGYNAGEFWKTEPRWNVYARFDADWRVTDLLMPDDDGALNMPAPVGEGWFAVAWPVNPHFTGEYTLRSLLECYRPKRS